MTAFVLGATGFVGREVVRQLAASEKTVAHVRPDSAKLAHWREVFGAQGADVDATPWDAAQLGARWRALAVDRVYILIGTTRGKAKQDRIAGNIYEAIDLGLTTIAVDAAKASGRTPRLVYLSSVGANPTASSAYLAARGKAEAAITGSGLPWAIARPSIITGERDDGRLGERSAAVVGDGLLAVARVFGGKRLADRYRSTTPDVLAAALIRIANAPAADVVYDGAALRT